MSINLNQAEARAMWTDIVKFLTVAVVIHLLFYTVDDYGNFMNEAVLKIFLYITLGFLVYHLIINKLIEKYLFPGKQDNKDNKDNKDNTEKIKNVTPPKKHIKPILKKNGSTHKKNKQVKFKE